MEIVTIKTGYLEENCYLLINNNNCIVIDPGADSKRIINRINNMNVVAILITHNHFDHIGAVNDIKEKYGTQVFDKTNLKQGNHTFFDFNFEVIYNSGHSSDSISFYFKELNAIFVGDFIFKGSVGRWDLETGNKIELFKSLKKFKQRYKNNPELIIYPGHGDHTSVGYELENNMFF